MPAPSHDTVRPNRYSVLLAALALLLAGSPITASAQTGRESHWGVSASFTPAWELTDSLKNLFDLEEGEELTLTGSEFTIGFVRGSTLGGDWGVSFVRKPFDDGSGGVSIKQDCFGAAERSVCRPNTETTVTEGVYLNGVEVHWFKPFVTIAERVQVGLNVGGGIAGANGTVIIKTDRFEPTGFGPLGGVIGFRSVHEEERAAAKDELISVLPLLKVEVEGSVILAPAFKLKAAGGVNFPAYSARVGLVYLFGAQ